MAAQTAVTTRRPTAVDLFCGAGGFSLGLEQAGFDVVAGVEYDPVHAAAHKFNFPRTELLCRDVAALAAEELRDAAVRGAIAYGRRPTEVDDVDLVVGGPPCQGFSLIGKRIIDDPRNQLVFHFFRLVTELRPRYFVMENVPGIRIGGHSSILEHLVEDFERSGYRVVHPVRALNAADFGVPQLRSRVFLLGARGDQRLPDYPSGTVSPTNRSAGSLVTALPVGPSVWDAIGDLPDLDKFPELLSGDEVRLSAQEVADGDALASQYARALRELEADSLDFSEAREWPRDVLTSSARTRHTARSIQRFADTAPGSVEPISRFLRLDPHGLCNTLRAGTGSERGAYTSPRPIHPYLPRVISVREAARLHSFPDWFRFHRTKWHGFRQIGNAVAPYVGRAVACEIAAALGALRSTPPTRVELGSDRLLAMTMAESARFFSASKNEMPASRRRLAIA